MSLLFLFADLAVDVAGTTAAIPFAASAGRPLAGEHTEHAIGGTADDQDDDHGDDESGGVHSDSSFGLFPKSDMILPTESGTAMT